MRHISPTASTRFPFPDSRFTINGIPFASTSTSTRWGVLIVRSRSVFNPQSAIDSWLIVNQRIPPLREPRPWLHLDDVIEQRSLEPELDLPGGGAERATPLGRPRRRRLLEPGPERRGDAIPVGGWIFEDRFDQPRCAVLELGAHAHHLHPPADASRMLERALEQLVQRAREQLALGDRREKGDRGDDRLGRLTAHDPLDCHPRREPPQAAAGPAELRDDRFLRQRGELAEGLEPELSEPAVCVGIEREHRERLGGEKLRLVPRADDDCSAWLRPACRNPGYELSESPPHPDCGLRIADCGFDACISNPQSAIHNPQLHLFDDPLRLTIQSP